MGIQSQVLGLGLGGSACCVVSWALDNLCEHRDQVPFPGGLGELVAPGLLPRGTGLRPRTPLPLTAAWKGGSCVQTEQAGGRGRPGDNRRERRGLRLPGKLAFAGTQAAKPDGSVQEQPTGRGFLCAAPSWSSQHNKAPFTDISTSGSLLES